MRFPITDLLDEKKCYDFILTILHPDGLKCSDGHHLPQEQAPHDNHRSPRVSTSQLADELNKDYGTLLERRHKIQQLALENRPLRGRRPRDPKS